MGRRSDPYHWDRGETRTKSGVMTDDENGTHASPERVVPVAACGESLLYSWTKRAHGDPADLDGESYPYFTCGACSRLFYEARLRAINERTGLDITMERLPTTYVDSGGAERKLYLKSRWAVKVGGETRLEARLPTGFGTRWEAYNATGSAKLIDRYGRIEGTEESAYKLKLDTILHSAANMACVIIGRLHDAGRLDELLPTKAMLDEQNRQRAAKHAEEDRQREERRAAIVATRNALRERLASMAERCTNILDAEDIAALHEAARQL